LPREETPSQGTAASAIPGDLYLIPTPLGDVDPSLHLSPTAIEAARKLERFVVENEKAAWRFLSRIKGKEELQRVSLAILDEHTPPEAVPALLVPALEGLSMGLISEAGCPGIADPGALLVALAHEKRLRVRPLVGPCSPVLALMASGFPGQRFAFHGYLPQDREGREARLLELERRARVEAATQVFIETPYRNDNMVESMLRVLDGRTAVCVAADLSLESETIRSGTVEEWRLAQPEIGKRPAVFLIAGAESPKPGFEGRRGEKRIKSRGRRDRRA
jgi:16S rRNA (cytidine1402-2'-O)-methyltransferase